MFTESDVKRAVQNAMYSIPESQDTFTKKELETILIQSIFAAIKAYEDDQNRKLRNLGPHR